VTSYKLYPGGQSYNVPQLGGTISNTTYQADPRTNPAGIFFRSGDLTVSGNTTVIGTLVSTGNVILSGTNITLTGNSLTPITGTTASPQLPTIVASSQVRISDGANVTIRGTVAAFDYFVGLAGAQGTQCDLQGNLISRSLDIQDRTEWTAVGTGPWNGLYSSFLGQSGTLYFPLYCWQQRSLSYTPLLTVSANSSSVIPLWFTNGSPVYAAGSSDPGLKWSVLRITELR
jgi:hypothetical protein